MIQNRRLGGKHIIKLEIAFEMIQLIAGSKAFHSAILKMNFDVQEVISPYSLNEISLSNTPLTWK